ncbi:SRPBCC family protein [Streptomyces lunalinharesii]|uniref:SRPBCC family protein n=1 Tax=Streptomyces lunalinharesii TaxID=333384 RepID=A0ABP6FL42_9ACTN
MARVAQDETKAELDRLRDELGDFVTAWAGNLAERAGDKLTGVTDQLSDITENGGSLGEMGAALLGGGLPLKKVLGGAVKGLGGSVLEKVKGSFAGGKRSSGDHKVTNIVEVIDVGLPVRTVYNHWTEFEKFSSFAKGVRDVSTSDEVTTHWKAKVGPSTRTWKATVLEQVPDERIVWTSEGAKGSTRGMVSFHEVTSDLTRVVLVVEYYPMGFFEKTGNLWRAQGRRLRLDLKHFQRHASLAEEEPEGWRGEIRDGEVVLSHEEGLEEDEVEGDYDDEEDDDERSDAYEDEEAEDDEAA